MAQARHGKGSSKGGQFKGGSGSAGGAGGGEFGQGEDRGMLVQESISRFGKHPSKLSPGEMAQIKSKYGKQQTKGGRGEKGTREERLKKLISQQDSRYVRANEKGLGRATEDLRGKRLGNLRTTLRRESPAPASRPPKPKKRRTSFNNLSDSYNQHHD
jgi:hypothetical protein